MTVQRSGLSVMTDSLINIEVSKNFKFFTSNIAGDPYLHFHGDHCNDTKAQELMGEINELLDEETKMKIFNLFKKHNMVDKY